MGCTEQLLAVGRAREGTPVGNDDEHSTRSSSASAAPREKGSTFRMLLRRPLLGRRGYPRKRKRLLPASIAGVERDDMIFNEKRDGDGEPLDVLC